MFIGKCEYCGQAFSAAGGKICAKCVRELDIIFTQIRRYLYSADTEVTPADITEALDIPEKAVVYLIDSGRLVSEKRISYRGKCQICGRPAANGMQMCSSCSESINSGINKYKSERATDVAKQPNIVNGVQPMINGIKKL